MVLLLDCVRKVSVSDGILVFKGKGGASSMFPGQD